MSMFVIPASTAVPRLNYARDSQGTSINDATISEAGAPFNCPDARGSDVLNHT